MIAGRVTTENETCWTVIGAAALGDDTARDRFVRRYLPVIRAALAARWRGRALESEIEDAVQNVILECIREDGALARASAERGSGFRGFLFGVTRNVALRHEARFGRRGVELTSSVAAGDADDGWERSFDRAWAESVVAEARARLTSWADVRGEAAIRRVRILTLRYGEGLTLRAIASRFGCPEKRVQKDYMKAEAEFAAMLRQVVAFHVPSGAAEVETECRSLLALLT